MRRRDSSSVDSLSFNYIRLLHFHGGGRAVSIMSAMLGIDHPLTYEACAPDGGRSQGSSSVKVEPAPRWLSQRIVPP